MENAADAPPPAPARPTRWEHFRATGHTSYETSYEHEPAGTTTCATCHAEVKG